MLVTERFYLDHTFIESYRNKPVPWGFGAFSETVYYSRYSRLRWDGKQEQWVDTVTRVVEGAWSIWKDWCKKHQLEFDQEFVNGLAESMFDMIFHMRFLPPGRGLWAMGTDYVFERGSAALNNCFSGETEFLTKEHGVVSLRDFVGQQVSVMTESGWREADIKAFGVQPVQEVTFVPAASGQRGWKKLRTNLRHTVTVTPDHRWILGDGTDTTSLKEGDVVMANACGWRADGPEEDLWNGFRHGLVFADGTLTHTTQEGVHAFSLRLCGDKAGYAAHFENVTYPETCNGDPQVYIKTTADLRAVPPTAASHMYLHGFIQGWIAGDASQTPSGSWCLSGQNAAAFDWLEKYAPYAGFVVTGRNTDVTTETNFGTRKAPLERLTLAEGNRAWKVEHIEALPGEREVFCAVVPEVHAFTLAGGIYTSNCAFVEFDHKNLSSAAQWAMDMLMCGVGVGFRVPEYDPEHASFKKMRLGYPDPKAGMGYVIPDTREGWAESIRLLIKSYEDSADAGYCDILDDGELGPPRKGAPTVSFDYSQIRAAGELIHGFGGKASGSVPLELLHKRLREFLDAYVAGKVTETRLVTDIMNSIGACVVAGNVRRSAELAAGDPADEEFLNLKNYSLYPERKDLGWMSNNSLVLDEPEDFLKIPALAARVFDNGEPGLINAMNIAKYGRFKEKKPDKARGFNPCAEIPLESYELCNLVEVFPTRCDDEWQIYDAMHLATIYATLVSLLPTHDSRSNAVIARNRRIGVSISGVADWLDASDVSTLTRILRNGYENTVVPTNAAWAQRAGIPAAVRVTTVKPSGTVSQLAGVSPGMHWPVYSYYIRRVRNSMDSPVSQILIDAGVPYEKDAYSPNTWVFEFPEAAGAGKTRSVSDVSLWEQASLVAFLQREWADNAVSNTLNFSRQPTPEQREDETLEEFAYRMRRFEDHRHEVVADIERVLSMFTPQIKSLSLFPNYEGGAYVQPPYEKITREEYRRRKAQLKPIDWSKLQNSDGEDSRYCESDHCEIEPVTEVKAFLTKEL